MPTTPEPKTRPARSCARLIALSGVSAARELDVVAGVAQVAGSSALVIAGLTGESASLGRFQRPGRSGLPTELRRISGGRSTRNGDGVVSLTALVPGPRAWLDETSELSGARLLNRLVRGLLAGLAQLGVPAVYPGRDFLTTNGRRVASVSLGREPSGVVVFQATLAVTSPCGTAEPEPVWPGLPPAPEATWLARERPRSTDFARIANALASGFAERFGLAIEEPAQTSAERSALAGGVAPPLVDAELAGLASAGPVAIPIGELEACVSLDASGRLSSVRLVGDWMASLSELRALEAALVGELPQAPRVRELCAAWLARPASLIVGLTSADALAGAIARSARVYSGLPPSSA